MFLVKKKGILHECNSASAVYLFQQDKFYDVSYDTGDKSIQCGRKVDVFKFWLMLKARGTSGFELLIDNVMEQAAFITERLAQQAVFRLVQKQFQYTNICFWYIPKALQIEEESEEWWNKIYQIVPIIKEKMVQDGSIMIAYTPLPTKNVGNFFRMTLTCFPPPTKGSIDFLLNKIEKLGEESFNELNS